MRKLSHLQYGIFVWTTRYPVLKGKIAERVRFLIR